MLDSPFITKAIDWLVVALTGGVSFMLHKLFSHDRRIGEQDKSLSLVERDQLHASIRRVEDLDRIEKMHQSLADKVDRHHSIIMSRLDLIISPGGRSRDEK